MAHLIERLANNVLNGMTIWAGGGAGNFMARWSLYSNCHPVESKVVIRNLLEGQPPNGTVGALPGTKQGGAPTDGQASCGNWKNLISSLQGVNRRCGLKLVSNVAE